MMEKFPQIKANLIQSLKPCLSTQKTVVHKSEQIKIRVIINSPPKEKSYRKTIIIHHFCSEKNVFSDLTQHAYWISMLKTE